jgi:hypothetical protein
MKKYQYKHFNESLTSEQLNELGQEGYQLVSHSAVVLKEENYIGTFTTIKQYYIFMKEIINNDEIK